MSSRTIRTAPAICVALMMAASDANAATIWQNDWLVSSPPTLQDVRISAGPGKMAQAIAFGADHELVIAAPSLNTIQYHVMRLRSDGSIRWSAGIYEYDHRSQAYAIHALPDGGALVALGYGDGEQFGDVIVRYAGDGGVAWTRKFPSGWLARVSPTRTASAGCSRLTVFDVADGQVAWQRELGKRDACGVGGLVSDADGNLYASIQQTANFALTGYRIAAFDAQGAPRWHVDSDDATGGAVVGLAGTLLLVRGSAELRALRSNDGSLAWSAPISGNVRILISRDGTEEALVVGGGTVQRLASDTGMPRWTVAWAGDVATAETIDDALLLTGADGSRARLDTSNGAVAWSVTGGGVHWLGFGDPDAGTLQGLAQPHVAGPGTPPAILHAIDFASGAIVDSTVLPAIPQGFDVIDTLAIDDDVVSFGMIREADAPHLRLRRVDRETGVTTWERDEPIDEFGAEYRFALPRASVVANGARIAASMPIAGEFQCELASGWARVAAYRTADGGRDWVATLRDPDQRCTRVSAPASDSVGNVFVSVVAIVPCGDGTVMGCQRRTLYKLAAADGSVAWRVDEEFDAGSAGFVMRPSDFQVLGSDVLVKGEFIGSPASVRRHSGTDGSILWSSTELATSTGFTATDIRILDEQRLLLHAHAPLTDMFGWAALDADDGATLWSNEAPVFGANCVPSPSCTLGYGADSRLLPAGDLLDPYQQDYVPWFARWRYDGSGQIDHWIAASGSPITTSAVGWLAPDATDATLFRRHRGAGGSMQLLAALDSATGLLQAQRALYGYHPGFLEYHAFRRPLSIPASDRLLATTHTALPSQPVAYGLALLDTSITASGNLWLDVVLDANRVGPGDVVGFEVRASYQGDAAIEGAALLMRLPWGGGVRNVACETIAAAGCTLDLRGGQVNATIDMAPGAGIIIRGDVDVLAAGEALVATAMVTGPLGLAEADTLDNFARVEILQSLFRSGFEVAP